jgi:hypothetical protein
LGAICTVIVFSGPNCLAVISSLASVHPDIHVTLCVAVSDANTLPHIRLGYAKLPCNLRRLDARFKRRTNGIDLPTFQRDVRDFSLRQ